MQGWDRPKVDIRQLPTTQGKRVQDGMGQDITQDIFAELARSHAHTHTHTHTHAQNSEHHKVLIPKGTWQTSQPEWQLRIAQLHVSHVPVSCSSLREVLKTNRDHGDSPLDPHKFWSSHRDMCLRFRKTRKNMQNRSLVTTERWIQAPVRSRLQLSLECLLWNLYYRPRTISLFIVTSFTFKNKLIACFFKDLKAGTRDQKWTCRSRSLLTESLDLIAIKFILLGADIFRQQNQWRHSRNWHVFHNWPRSFLKSFDWKWKINSFGSIWIMHHYFHGTLTQYNFYGKQ